MGVKEEVKRGSKKGVMRRRRTIEWNHGTKE